MCGRQVKLCDPLVTSREPYLSALEITSLLLYKALYKFAFFTFFYVGSFSHDGRPPINVDNDAFCRPIKCE